MSEHSIPNPGSVEARARGCKCSQWDNHQGAGIPLNNGSVAWLIDPRCPLHAREKT